MSQVSGVVQEITTRSVAGGKTAYNIKVGGQSYGAGLQAPKAREGDYVTFNVDESRGFKNVERGSLKVSANKPAPAAAASTYAAKPANSFDSRQDAISRQAASNTAIAFLELAIKAEALSLPKTKRQEALETYLHKYEQMFYERNTGVKWKNIAPGAENEEEYGAGEEEADAPEDQPWE